MKLYVALIQGAHIQQLTTNAYSLKRHQELFEKVLDGPFGPKAMVSMFLK